MREERKEAEKSSEDDERARGGERRYGGRWETDEREDEDGMSERRTRRNGSGEREREEEKRNESERIGCIRSVRSLGSPFEREREMGGARVERVSYENRVAEQVIRREGRDVKRDERLMRDERGSVDPCGEERG
ncbi:hypothetical protein Tco_1246003 [Tanacetum coccineum]